MTSKKIKKIKIFKKIFLFSIIFLFFFYIFQINESIENTTKRDKLKSKLDSVLIVNKDLKINLFKNGNLKQLTILSQNKNFEKIKNIEYIKVPNNFLIALK